MKKSKILFVILLTVIASLICININKIESYAYSTTNTGKYTAMQYVIDDIVAGAKVKSFTCLKDSTIIIVVSGTEYQASGNVKLNDSILYEYNSSTYSPKFMQITNVKEGDVITFNLDGSTTGYRMFGFIIHEDGVF